MHIAHFTNTYKPNVNGVVRSISTFREGFIRSGHQVFIFCQQADDFESDEPFVYRYPALKIPGVDYSAAVPVSRFVDKLLPTLKLNVIHSNHPTLLGDAAANYAEKYDLPLVFTFHTRYVEYAGGYLSNIPFAKGFVEGQLVDSIGRYMQRAQHIITPSDSIKDSLAKSAGISERVTTIPTGIDFEHFQQADGQAVREKYNLGDKKVLVTISRLAEEKNVKTLLKAVKEVMDVRDDVLLLVIGDGPQRSDLEKFAADIGISKRVRFTGLVPFEAVPNHLKAGDLFIYSSITETQGLVTAEAMATGLPVVAVDATGTSDTVEDGVQGLLTANDSSALAQAALRVLDDDALYAQFQETAVARAKDLDMMSQAEKMLDVYRQAIEDKKAGRSVQVDMKRLHATIEDDNKSLG